MAASYGRARGFEETRVTDNGSPADANAASDPVEEFPSKLRVHALARVLGLTSRQVLAHLAELGWHTRSPQSSVEREMAQAVAQRVRETEPPTDGTDAATPPTEATQVETPHVEPTVAAVCLLYTSPSPRD